MVKISFLKKKEKKGQEGGLSEKLIEFKNQEERKPIPKAKFTNKSNKGGETATEESSIPSIGSTTVKRIDEDYGYDYCIVVPHPDYQEPDEDYIRKVHMSYYEILDRLHMAQLETYQFRSGDGDEVLIKIRAPLHVLKKWATFKSLVVECNPDYLYNVIDSPILENKIAQNSAITSLQPYDHMFFEYDEDRDQQLYEPALGYNHPFSNRLRIKLINTIIRSASDDAKCTGCSLDLDKIMNDKDKIMYDKYSTDNVETFKDNEWNHSILKSYPLHDYAVRDDLWTEWSSHKFNPWDSPTDEIKEYLGEKICLYFEFTSHVTSWLQPLAVMGGIVTLGVVVQAVYVRGLSDGLTRSYVVPFFSVYVSFWGQFMIEYWKRKQAYLAMTWGTTEAQEEIRADYEGEETRSLINGKLIRFVPSDQVWHKKMVSNLCVAGFILLDLVVIAGIFALQQFFEGGGVADDTVDADASMLVGMLSGVQIIVLNSLYTDHAISLNEYENHRTQTEYDDSLIAKLFIFTFCNSYASLYYVAFVKTQTGSSCDGGCFYNLAYQLLIILLSKVTIEKITTFFTIYIQRKYYIWQQQQDYASARARMNEEGKKITEPSPIEEEGEFEVYDPSLGVLMDYGTIFVGLGFVTLFVAACPIAPCLAYVSNLVEIYSDSWKLLYMSQRVLPQTATLIGTWEDIMQILAVIAVVTNAAILCFTMEVLSYSSAGVFWTFLLFQAVIFFVVMILAWVVPDVPEEVYIQQQRGEYLRSLLELGDEARAEKFEKESNGATKMSVHQSGDADADPSGKYFIADEDDSSGSESRM